MAYSSDPTLWLYTSLSSGSSQIVTATSRLETILKANRIPFKALDVATDEKARMLWGRRAGKRKLPGLVRMGMVIGDIDEIEEWNEYGELKEQVGADVLAPATKAPAKVASTASTKAPSAPIAPPIPSTSDANAAAAKSTSTTTDRPKPVSSISFAPEKSKEESTGPQASMSLAMRQLGQEAAERAKKNKADALAARKAELAAAEKSSDSASKSEAPAEGASATDTTIALETTDEQGLSKSNFGSKQSATTTANDSHDVAETTKAVPEDTTSGINATRPESPLPATGESIATEKPTSTAAVDITSSGANASRLESPLPVPGEEQAAKESSAGTKSAADSQTSAISEDAQAIPSAANAARPESPLPAAGESEPAIDAESKTADSTASAVNALGPESPLPAVEDVKPLPKQETAIAANATRPESPLPAAGETEPSESAISESTASTQAVDIMPNPEMAKHRGSSISAASKEEIKHIEEANKIPEEPEEENNSKAESKIVAANEKQPVKFEDGQEHKTDAVKEKLGPGIAGNQADEKTNASTPIQKQEDVPAKDKETVKTQEQPAAEPTKATESVHD